MKTFYFICGGHKNQYKYEILPVPFKTVVTGIPVLHSSGETKYEKQIGDELIKVIDTVEGIRFTDIKELGNKAKASLGYYNNKIKKTISSASNDYKKYEKDKDSQIQSQIYLFPMIMMSCLSKRGSKFEIYSIGSGNKFIFFKVIATENGSCRYDITKSYFCRSNQSPLTSQKDRRLIKHYTPIYITN